jgi:hypothetical protein
MKFGPRSVTLNTLPEDPMKPIAISSYLAFAALSLYAADPQASKESSTPQPATHTQAPLSTQTSGIGDSPLVRAAKSANRFGKKPSQVITNESLVHDGGHFTTTSAEAQAPLPAGSKSTEPSLDQMSAKIRRARAEASVTAEQAKKLEEQKKITAARAAAREEGDVPEGLYNDAPALEEVPVQTLKPVTLPQKPPQ